MLSYLKILQILKQKLQILKLRPPELSDFGSPLTDFTPSCLLSETKNRDSRSENLGKFFLRISGCRPC